MYPCFVVFLKSQLFAASHSSVSLCTVPRVSTVHHSDHVKSLNSGFFILTWIPTNGAFKCSIFTALCSVTQYPQQINIFVKLPLFVFCRKSKLSQTLFLQTCFEHSWASAVPVIEEYWKQSFGCLHHVVVLLSKEHADPAAEVSGFHQLLTVPLQEDPQPVQIPIHLCITGDPCCELTGRETATQLNLHVRGVPHADKTLYCSSTWTSGYQIKL